MSLQKTSRSLTFYNIKEEKQEQDEDQNKGKTSDHLEEEKETVYVRGVNLLVTSSVFKNLRHF